MANRERYGARDLIFNTWHRAASIERYIPKKAAYTMLAQDIDLVEYDGTTGQAVLIHEVGRDIGQENKPTWVIKKLAQRANCMALLTLYTPSEELNPVDDRFYDIVLFRTRRVWPNEEKTFTTMTPAQYANYLNNLVKKLKANGDPNAK